MIMRFTVKRNNSKNKPRFPLFVWERACPSRNAMIIHSLFAKQKLH